MAEIKEIKVNSDVLNALLPQKNLLNMAGEDLTDGEYAFVDQVKPPKKSKISLNKVSDDNFRLKFRFKNTDSNKIVTIGIGALLFMRVTDSDSSEGFEPEADENANLQFVHEHIASEAKEDGNEDTLSLPNHFKIIHTEDKIRKISGKEFKVYPSYTYKALQERITGKSQKDIDKVFSDSNFMMGLPSTEALDTRYTDATPVQNLTVNILS